MKTEHQVLVLAFVVGLSFWLIDSILCFFYFQDQSFLDQLILNITPHHLTARLLVILLAVVFAVVGIRYARQRTSAEQDLRDSEDHFRAFTDSALDGVCLSTLTAQLHITVLLFSAF